MYAAFPLNAADGNPCLGFLPIPLAVGSIPGWPWLPEHQRSVSPFFEWAEEIEAGPVIVDPVIGAGRQRLRAFDVPFLSSSPTIVGPETLVTAVSHEVEVFL